MEKSKLIITNITKGQGYDSDCLRISVLVITHIHIFINIHSNNQFTIQELRLIVFKFNFVQRLTNK